MKTVLVDLKHVDGRCSGGGKAVFYETDDPAVTIGTLIKRGSETIGEVVGDFDRVVMFEGTDPAFRDENSLSSYLVNYGKPVLEFEHHPLPQSQMPADRNHAILIVPNAEDWCDGADQLFYTDMQLHDPLAVTASTKIRVGYPEIDGEAKNYDLPVKWVGIALGFLKQGYWMLK